MHSTLHKKETPIKNVVLLLAFSEHGGYIIIIKETTMVSPDASLMTMHPGI